MTSNIETVRQLASQIDGFLSDDEGELLYRLARNVPRGQAIVELGRFKGKSTVWLAKGTESGQKNRVYSIAPAAGSKDRISGGNNNTSTTFLTNLTKAGVHDTVVALAITSDNAAKLWKKNVGLKVGLLWVNASREYEDVKKTLLSWKQYLVPGAIVALHNCDQPGPAQVVKECFGPSGDFAIIQSVDTTVVAEKDKCIHYWNIDSNDIGVCNYCGKTRSFKRPFGQPAPKGKTGKGSDMQA